MNKLIDAVKTFLSGVEYMEEEENANYVVTKEDKELLQEAIDTVVTYCEKMQNDKIDFLKSAKEPNEITHPYDLSRKEATE